MLLLLLLLMLDGRVDRQRDLPLSILHPLLLFEVDDNVTFKSTHWIWNVHVEVEKYKLKLKMNDYI